MATTTHSHKGYDFEELSFTTIGACIDVQKHLGPHCMEVDYQRALEIALLKRGIPCECEVEIPLYYEGLMISKRRVDFLIGDKDGQLFLETKARKVILDEDIEQCLLYLQQGGYSLCLLVNFGEIPLGVKRLVHTAR